MKQLFTLTLLMLSILMYSQEYNKFSIEPHVGFTKIRDITPVEAYNVGLSARQMFNPYFGIQLTGQWTNIPQVEYYSGQLQGVINVGRIMHMEDIFNNRWTILGTIGGDYTFSDKNNIDKIYHRISDFHLMGGIKNEFRITDRLFLTAGLNVITGVNNRPDICDPITATTSIINFNAGIVIPFGRHKKHADWFIPVKETNTVIIDKTVTNNPIVNNVYNNIVEECNCIRNEYVFFQHDSHEVTKDGLNAIMKSAQLLKEGETIFIRGYASPPGTDDYNMKLAEKRNNSVLSKLISLGVDRSQIEIEIIGEMNTQDNDNVDLMRYVSLEVR